MEIPRKHHSYGHLGSALRAKQTKIADYSITPMDKVVAILSYHQYSTLSPRTSHCFLAVSALLGNPYSYLSKAIKFELLCDRMHTQSEAWVREKVSTSLGFCTLSGLGTSGNASHIIMV